MRSIALLACLASANHGYRGDLMLDTAPVGMQEKHQISRRACGEQIRAGLKVFAKLLLTLNNPATAWQGAAPSFNHIRKSHQGNYVKLAKSRSAVLMEEEEEADLEQDYADTPAGFSVVHRYNDTVALEDAEYVSDESIQLDDFDKEKLAGANAFMQGPPKVRATKGKEAFDNTRWQVYIQLEQGPAKPSALFTVTLKDDETAVFTNNEKVDNTLLKEDWTAVFTDNENVGSWKADGRWVTFKKPEGLFKSTLVFNACIEEPPGWSESPWKLKLGDVHRRQDEEETETIGVFSAIEFQETVNLYNEPLKKCHLSGAAAGSSQEDGKCDEMGVLVMMKGVHSLCVSELPANFSETTGQGNWTRSEATKPGCVSIGAWSLYIAKGSTTQAHCEAIPGFVFGENYIQHWSTWNGNELDDQIVNGINELYSQCSKGKEGSKLAALKSNYCKVTRPHSYAYSRTDQWKEAECGEPLEEELLQDSGVTSSKHLTVQVALCYSLLLLCTYMFLQ
mmetsp:Transcript_144840/g.252592  ORF Transcript_144840/g.252592 Transcript_144840/m.252592 type:complete len:507 (+) Transcript_144840:76-1596(+)